MPDRLPLYAALSGPLVAFTIEADDALERFPMVLHRGGWPNGA
ncbi:MAG TPA: hypothetical protein VHW04_16330 [Solirubrobacteraceae bacterium]|nr:hypothetical protein [Solirubrobacteraceae bacterium]